MTGLDRRTFLVGTLAALAGACSRATSPDEGAAPTTSAPGAATASDPPATTAPVTTSDTGAPATTTTSPVTTDGAAAPSGWVPPADQYPAVEPFALGVASGEPAPASVLLWTRSSGAGPVTVTVASDPALADVVTTRVVERDGSGVVRLTIDGLTPGGEWFYRFEQDGVASPTGRATTLPDAGVERFVVALASCQHYEEGYFTALGDIADSGPDLVVHTGDFVYARAAGGEPVRVLPGGHGTIDDDDERSARYDAYLRDPHLQRARAAAPWLALWDDNDLRGGGDPARAWFDHVPVTESSTGDLRHSIDVGDLARVVVVDTRSHRDPPVCDPIPGLGGARRCDALEADERTMLGTDQEAWLAGVLDGPPVPWTLVAGQVVVTDLAVDVGGVGAVNDDQWDGYPAARRRLFGGLAGVQGAVVLSGDLHTAGLSTLRDDAGTVVGHEVLGPSISSVVPGQAALGLEVAALGQPDLEFLDTDHRGWVRLDIARDHLGISFRRVDALAPDAVAADGPVYDLDAAGALRAG